MPAGTSRLMAALERPIHDVLPSPTQSPLPSMIPDSRLSLPAHGRSSRRPGGEGGGGGRLAAAAHLSLLCRRDEWIKDDVQLGEEPANHSTGLGLGLRRRVARA